MAGPALDINPIERTAVAACVAAVDAITEAFVIELGLRGMCLEPVTILAAIRAELGETGE
jgi:hypothetical protein